MQNKMSKLNVTLFLQPNLKTVLLKLHYLFFCTPGGNKTNCKLEYFCLKTLLWQSARYKLSIYVESRLWLLDECMSNIQGYQLSYHQTTEQLSVFRGPQRTSSPKNENAGIMPCWRDVRWSFIVHKHFLNFTAKQHCSILLNNLSNTGLVLT